MTRSVGKRKKLNWTAGSLLLLEMSLPLLTLRRDWKFFCCVLFKYSTKVENYAIEEALHFFHHPFNVVDAILLMHTEIRTGMTFSSSRVILSWLSPHVHELTTRNRLITTRKSFLSWLITGLQSHVHELTMLVPRVILNFLSILMQRYAILMCIWRIKGQVFHRTYLVSPCI